MASVGATTTTGTDLVDQRDRPVLHLAAGIALGVDVGDLLQLQRAFQRDREGRAAAHVEDVARLGEDVLGDAPVLRPPCSAPR